MQVEEEVAIASLSMQRIHIYGGRGSHNHFLWLRHRSLRKRVGGKGSSITRHKYLEATKLGR